MNCVPSTINKTVCIYQRVFFGRKELCLVLNSFFRTYAELVKKNPFANQLDTIVDPTCGCCVEESQTERPSEPALTKHCLIEV